MFDPNIEGQIFATKAAALQFLKGIGGYETYEASDGQWYIRPTPMALDRAAKERKGK